MGDPFSLATGVLSVVGVVLKLASGAMAMVDKTVTAHSTQRRVVRNLRHELDKTITGSACMQITLKAMLGNPKDKIVKRMCRNTECIIALQELTKALETTQDCIEQWVNNENSAPIVPHNALPSKRKSLEFIQAVFKHNVSPAAIDDAIEAVEELQFEVTKYREKAEIAFQHLWHLYSVQNFRALQGHASVESFASVSTRVSVQTVESISNRIAECSAHCAEGDGELDPIQWLHEQASQADLHPPPISSQVLSGYEGQDAISEDDWSDASSTDTTVYPPPTASDPSTILAILQFVGVATKAVCQAIDKAIELKHEERYALMELRKGVDSLKSDTLVYKALLNSMENDTDLGGLSSYTCFIQRQDVKEAMESLERALKATRLLLEENPAGNRHEVPINPFGNKKSRRAINFVLNIYKPNFRWGHRHKLIGDLKEATYEIFECQQDNKRAFKRVWSLYVAARQWTGRPSSVDNVGNIQDSVGQALDSVLHAFHDHPFAVSPEGDSRVDLPTFAILNQDHETAIRHEKLARQIGKAWVDDGVRKNNEQVIDIGALQTSLFELLWSGTVEHLKRDSASAYSADDPERPEFERAVEELERALQEAIVHSKKRCFTIALCGMVKAGKSLFLNALMGRAILPSDELPSTAWPCRLRHVEGQTIPELQFQAEPFLAALKKLQAHQYGRKMQTYQPPPKNMFEPLLSDAPSEPSKQKIFLRTIYSQWIDLHAATRDNLLKFEMPGYKLPRMATGEQNVKVLLGQLNDIVRLCQRFDLKFDMGEVDWPLLTVEFNSLRGHRVDGTYEFIDLPGIGEGFPDSNFESLVRLVAFDSDAIVPIVSFKEISRSDWKRLPELVTSGFNRRANVVVCTHLDQVSLEHMDEQLKTVTKTFWPRDPWNTNRVIPCSTLMGLSARDLLDSSNTTMPPFEAIWNQHAVGYPCAAKILGMRDPRASYGLFDIETWRDALQAELRDSGLPGAIQKLTKEMGEGARINALLREADMLIRQLRKMSSVQERKLLEARRTKDDYNSAKGDYDRARKKFQAVLDAWIPQEWTQIEDHHSLLERVETMISQEAYRCIGQAIEKTLQDWRLGATPSEDGDLGCAPRGAFADEKGGVKILTVKKIAHAEEFLRTSQGELRSALNTVQLEYVTTIRKLAERAKDKRFKALQDMFWHLDPRLQPELCEAIVGDLESQPIDIVAFQQIRNVIETKATRYTAPTAFRTIEERIARQWPGFVGLTMGERESDSNLGNDAVQRRIDELGFMLRAPITALATVPFVFGLPIWLWKAQSRTYHLGMDVIYNRYKDEIVDPWIRSLRHEGERSLFGTILFSSKMAKGLVTSALEREDNRYKRELDRKSKPVDIDTVNHLIAVYGNLVAAEEALREVFIRLESLQARSEQ